MNSWVFALFYSAWFFFFCTLALTARADQLIIEPDMGRAPIISAINSAKYSVKLVMYGFTDQSLLDAIIHQKNNGRTVNIILEKDPYKAENENKKTFAELNKNHIPLRNHVSPFSLIHQKTLLLDDHHAMVMTFNFTRSTFKNERNFALILDDQTNVKQISAIFSADWNQVSINNVAADLIVSPDSRKKLMSLIAQAKKSIRIYAQNVSDYKIVGALAIAAKKGITIQLLTSTRLRKDKENYLTKAGITIRYSTEFIIHAKTFSIDDQLAMIGSINLTRTSLDNNRELSVITHDPSVVKQLNTTFADDWNKADQNML